MDRCVYVTTVEISNILGREGGKRGEEEMMSKGDKVRKRRQREGGRVEEENPDCMRGKEEVMGGGGLSPAHFHLLIEAASRRQDAQRSPDSRSADLRAADRKSPPTNHSAEEEAANLGAKSAHLQLHCDPRAANQSARKMLSQLKCNFG